MLTLPEKGYSVTIVKYYNENSSIYRKSLLESTKPPPHRTERAIFERRFNLNLPQP